MHLGLEGSVVMVTGGSKGIGAGIVRAFLSEGAHVAWCARSIPSTHTNGPIGFSNGHPSPQSIGTALDVTDPSALTSWVSATAAYFGRIDILVSSVSSLTFTSMPSSWSSAFNTDLLPLITIVPLVVPYLEKSPIASIITLGSASSAHVGPETKIQGQTPPYGPLKAAIAAHVRQLAHTLGPRGIRVNTISPGHVWFEGGAWDRVGEVVRKKAEEEVGLGRLAEVEEVSRVVVFLGSRVGGGYVAGANWRVDGGVVKS